MAHITLNGRDIDLDDECRDCGAPIVNGVCSADRDHLA
jgi:hypothetical protein